jgi:hypothetical protein
MGRPTPFDLVFADDAADRFPEIRDALAASGADPRDRDAFLLTLPAMTLLRGLRPDEEDAGEGVLELTALLHHAYLYWADGLHGREIPVAEARTLLSAGRWSGSVPPEAAYVQLPERLVWASLSAGGAWEPLDGCFAHSSPDGTLRVLGIFGVHPSRMGFTVAEAVGVPGRLSGRADGSPLFSPALEGGALAGLHALVDPGELVELAGRMCGAASHVAARVEGA